MSKKYYNYYKDFQFQRERKGLVSCQLARQSDHSTLSLKLWASCQAGFLLGLYLSHALTNQVLDLHECGFTHHSNNITAMTPDPSLVKGLACQSK